ncbi:MAG: NAD(P)/FAD-dependent oxidoreductase [Chitinophagaceae bacterium]|nr:MAG: NAD(P)/FAD-dependent oxidoreductase [Chitinophagaceae bacterium]
MKVVIVGGGFGGLKLARRLNNKPGFEIVLVDKYNYHQFQPLFYQVATAGLDASNISFPFRKAFHKSKNVRIRITELRQLVATENKIITDTGEITYDVLVLATGADTNFFGNQQLAEHAFPMKSTVEALQLRNRLIQNFEDAVAAKDETELQRLMDIVVVGGGPTGVEVSGALAEMKKYVLPKDYPELDFSKMNIYLLEGTGKTLGAMSEVSSGRSKKYLEKLDVKVIVNTHVKDYDGKNVFLQDGSTIPSSTVIWAAGVKGNVPEGVSKDLIVRGNRIKTDRVNKVIGSPNIYVIGDLAYMETIKYPHGHPQVATVAIQQAKLLSQNLKKINKGSTDLKEYEYYDKGSMATVGRNLAVVDIPKPKLHFGGFLAWLIWMGLHLMLILGVKNRFFVFVNWVYNYITYDQSLRLIFREFYKSPKPPTERAS